MVNMNHGMVLRRGFVVGEERRGNKKHTTTTTRDWLTITVCTLLMIVKVRLCCLSCFVWVGLVVFVSEWWWWWWCSRGTDTPTRGAARIATRRRNGNGICTLHYCMVFGGHWQSNRHTGLSCPNPTIRGGGGGLSGLPGSASEGADFHLRLSKWHARMADGRWAVVLSTVWYCAPPTAAVPCFAGRKRGGTQVHPSTTSNGRLQFRQPPACRFDKAILHSGFRARCVSRRTQTAGYGQGVHASGRLHRIHPSACIQFSPGIRAGMQTGCSRRSSFSLALPRLLALLVSWSGLVEASLPRRPTDLAARLGRDGRGRRCVSRTRISQHWLPCGVRHPIFSWGSALAGPTIRAHDRVRPQRRTAQNEALTHCSARNCSNTLDLPGGWAAARWQIDF